MLVSVANLRADMVLATDVVDGLGRLLLAGGTRLTDKHLRYCQMWGVMEAEVVGDEPPPAEADPIDAAALESADAEVRPLFRRCDLDHPVVAALYRYCVQARARRRG
jgi:hypothetical protein